MLYSYCYISTITNTTALTQLCRAIGLELSQTMGGSAGVLLAIFFSAVDDSLSGGQPHTQALTAGLARVARGGRCSPWPQNHDRCL